MRRSLAASFAVAVGIGALLHAQAPSFEVASVRPNTTGEAQSVPPIQPGGRVTLTSRTLRGLVQFAYSPLEAPLQESEIVAGPEWADRDRFDILAKVPGPAEPGRATAEMVRLALRTLLAERFALKLRRESRELAVYALVLRAPVDVWVIETAQHPKPE